MLQVPSIKEVHLVRQRKGVFSMVTPLSYPYKDKMASHFDSILRIPEDMVLLEGLEIQA